MAKRLCIERATPWRSSTHSSLIGHREGTTFRQFSTTKRSSAEQASPPPPSPSASSPSRAAENATKVSRGPSGSSGSMLGDLGALFKSDQSAQQAKAKARNNNAFDIASLSSIGGNYALKQDRHEEPHHFHIYAHRHNTHLTLTKPNREPLISVSCGNIGFKKAGRKAYDSAYQLAAYMLGRIQEQGLNAEIQKLEVTLRGFGAGREAVTKALLGQEGRLLRHKVVKVSDATRLKFGGTRSRKPRRLG